MLTVLVADDERSMQEFFEIMLIREGYDVITASTAEEAMEIVESRAIDLVISDMKMPKAGGMAVLRRTMDSDPDRPVIMISAFGSTDTAVEAMKMGAYDYITKPFKVDEIKLIIAKALERRSDKEELRRLKDEVARSYSLGEMVGKSESMQTLFRMIKKVSRTSSTVLISGESGTGKELVAKAIHYLSTRIDKPFNSVNCGALPEQLLESELFGHQKGSFTGAHVDKKGLLEVTDGGTIFMDEVGESALSIQVKLLRFLQEREFRRIGGVRDIKVDVRIISATNRDIEELIGEGDFSEDLFYRLNILPIHIPPLRDRREDIPLLVQSFFEKYAKITGTAQYTISDEAMAMLERHPWRGNVRELENMMERAVVLTTGSRIEVDNLSAEIRGSGIEPKGGPIDISEEGIDIEEIVNSLERDLLKKALVKTGGKKQEAAKLVKLSFRSFRYKLSKYGIGSAKDEDINNHD